MDKNSWYAIFVKTGEEDKVKERLNFRFRDEIQIIVPKRKLRERRFGIWRDVIRVLFPGYVLAYGTIDVEEYYKMKNVPGIIKLLRSGHLPLKIDYDEMEFINKLVFGDETIGCSDVLVENGNIVVVDGPLKSMEGQIISIDKRKGRAKVSLRFMGEERVIELEVNVLQVV